MRGINNITNLLQGTDPVDLFAFNLSYNDYTINGSYANVHATLLYNGNISQAFWRTSSDNILRQYDYDYDDLSRLTNAIYSKTGMTAADSYGETLSYDKNGNIQDLTRTGEYDDAHYALPIDELTYGYDTVNKNQLKAVYDSSNNPNGFKDDAGATSISTDGTDYEYDANGNMTKDTNKGIIQIKCNHLNLPTEIDFGGTTGKITYLYNAAGQKLQKTVSPTTGDEAVTDYLGGYQYKDGELQFFPHAEGYVNVTKGDYNYVFSYTDHLGNVRLTYGMDDSVNELKILEENNYYPFGLKHANYNMDMKEYGEILDGTVIPVPTDEIAYKYKYNGKELQDELGLNKTAMDYRQYDPAIGRFDSMDKLASMKYDSTPYRFAFNNPNFWIDPSGLFETRKEARAYRRKHNISGSISKNSDGGYSINDKKNATSYFKPEAGMEPSTTGADGIATAALVSNEPTQQSNAVSNGKTGNDYAGLVATGIEAMPGSFRLTGGLLNSSLSPKFYPSGWSGGSRAMISTYNIGKIGKGAGLGGAGLGLALDIQGVRNYYNPKYGPNSPNSVSPAKATLNTSMSAYGIWVNPIAPLLYNGIDMFYPGGWTGDDKDPGLAKDQDRLDKENKAINPEWQLWPGAMKQ